MTKEEIEQKKKKLDVKKVQVTMPQAVAAKSVKQSTLDVKKKKDEREVGGEKKVPKKQAGLLAFLNKNK